MKKIIVSLFALMIAGVALAVPAYRGWQTKTQPDGTTIEVRLVGDEFHHYWEDQAGNVVQCDSQGYWRVAESQPTPATIKARRQASHMLQSRPQRAIGDMNFAPRGLVILVNFKDSKFNNTNTASAMNDLMNSSSYTYNGATGSVRQYFSDQSDGQYAPDFDVIGPVTLPDYVSHYGGNDYEGNDKLPGDMVVEACSIANANYGVDFTQYDNNSDGEVDFVYLIYAGKGEADGGAANTIWPHNWDLESASYFGNCSYSSSQRRFDGKTINNYACSAELDGVSGKRAGIGTIAHEFSHVIGLPDLYDIDYGQNYENEATPGAWHIMDGGSYNNDGNTPPNYSIYDKYFLGWKTPINLGATAQNISLNAAGTVGYEGYQIATSNSLVSATSTNTVYYVENRQQSGWDAHLPGHGLLIWKVTYNSSVWADNGPNDQDGTLRYTIISASGKTTGIGTGADPFPGTTHKTEWRGVSGKPLLNITESDGIISLSYIEVVDENSCKYEVLSENATISSESGKVTKGETLTLTIKPAIGYLLDETMIEVEENNETRDFTFSNTTLTITNVQGDLGIYVMPEADPNYVPTEYSVTWMANGKLFAQATYIEGDKLILPATNPTPCTEGLIFMGWTATKDYSHPSQAPEYVVAGNEVLANATYYAVYATEIEGNANSTTISQSTFSAIEATMDEYISYKAEQGSAANAPAIYYGEIRIYQNGGILNVSAKEGAKMTSVTIGSSMKTKITYQVDGGNTSSQQSMAADSQFTVSGIQANHVKFTCKGTDKKSRIYLNYLEVSYTTGNETTYIDYSTNYCDIESAIDNTKTKLLPTKVIRNGQMFIIRDGITYTVLGERL